MNTLNHDHENPEEYTQIHFDPRRVREALEASHEANRNGQSFSDDLQIQELIEWGKNSCVFARENWEPLTLISNDTAEHEVRYHTVSHQAVKKTLSGNYGYSPQWDGQHQLKNLKANVVQYLTRLEFQNDLFGDDIRVVGVFSVEPSFVLFEDGTPPIVTVQSWRDGVDLDKDPFPSEGETSEYLKSFGFIPIKDAFFGWVREDDGIVILDAKPDNFVLTQTGIFPIDLQISKLVAAL